ncbi:GGDEF domain-containing protein [Candidatus Marinarcus aquaticus]|uniref:Diguanylate cyclase n=1 Tax=Candidatus Marinarcus aquaticus TaxID=2044504 RepID=A0A4Q0XQ90_9BACT|nr:sensor domain-containing diguanylate cyclase [Candidatus Marinarcus aquaticus]RXJ54447.1 diguanylate cyclase [Candidatus Marinarcus aquaticus]
MSSKQFRFMFFLYFMIFGLVITVCSSIIGYELQMQSIDEQIDKNAQEVAMVKKNITLKPILYKMDMLLMALAHNESLKNYITDKNDGQKEVVKNLFLTIAMTDQYIMQARYIDESGMEVIRVDRLNLFDKPFMVEDKHLQDKSRRDYFTSVKNTHKNAIWYSNIDLNIENGKIQVPYVPTIRIATPLYVYNEFKGMVILNLLAKEILNSLNKSASFEHYIVDKEGNYILHPNERYSFSKYKGINRTLYDDFPTTATQILSHQTKGKEFYTVPLEDVLENNDQAILVLKPKKEYESSLIKTNLKTTFWVLLLSIIISIPLALYASLVPSKLQKELLSSNKELQRFKKIIDTHVITATTQLDSIITSVSKAFVKASGYQKDELIGEKMNIIRHQQTPKELFTQLWSTIEKGEQWKSQIKNRRKDGSEYWLEQNIIPIKDEEGNIVEYMVIGEDISAKKELESLSMIDQLTKIYNRRKLDEILDHEFNRAIRYEKPLSIMLIDIDFFKKINDTYGHPIGDEVLYSVAQTFKNHIRSTDYVGRYGGEEFMIICPETKKEDAMILAEKLRKTIEEYPFKVIKNVTVSIGVSEYIAEFSVNEVIERADKALYKAKAQGRNQVI